MNITFIIPNRDDATKPPTLYEEYEAYVVPREGESVYLPDGGKGWVVKWVGHTFTNPLSNAPAHKIEVRLIEPGHWSRR